MPLPKPRKNEDKESFVARAVASPSIQKDFQTNEQRISVSGFLWENSDQKEESPGHFVKIQKTDKLNKVVKGVVYQALDIDTDGETMSVEDVQKAAWNFLAQRKEKNIDIQHDWQESGCMVVESYLTEKGDPNFPENSWVMAVKCTDDVFQKVIDGELNGFSFGGYSEKFAQKVLLEVAKQAVGETYENLNKEVIPGHKHSFIVWYDNDGKIVKGHTDTVDGHQHTISYGTSTDKSVGHSHRIDLSEG